MRGRGVGSQVSMCVCMWAARRPPARSFVRFTCNLVTKVWHSRVKSARGGLEVSFEHSTASVHCFSGEQTWRKMEGNQRVVREKLSPENPTPFSTSLSFLRAANFAKLLSVRSSRSRYIFSLSHTHVRFTGAVIINRTRTYLSPACVGELPAAWLTDVGVRAPHYSGVRTEFRRIIRTRPAPEYYAIYYSLLLSTEHYADCCFGPRFERFGFAWATKRLKHSAARGAACWWEWNYLCASLNAEEMMPSWMHCYFEF